MTNPASGPQALISKSMEALDAIEGCLPEGRAGPWTVDRFNVPKEQVLVPRRLNGSGALRLPERGPEILKCHEAGITATLPKPTAESNSRWKAARSGNPPSGPSAPCQVELYCPRPVRDAQHDVPAPLRMLPG